MKTITIEKRDYTNRDYTVFGDETDMCQEIEKSDASYICDAISEYADSYVPIYNSEIWSNASDCQEWIENAMNEGLTEGVTDLVKIFQIGMYLYYQEMASTELPTMAFNVMCNALEDINFKDDADESEIDDIMDSLANEFDHNDSWDDLIEKFKSECADMIEEETEE